MDVGPERLAIVVMGVSGSGKSTVGRALADALGAAFVDADDLHPSENVAKMAAGSPLTDEDRAPWLDRVGAAIAARPGPVVVACSALRRGYRDRLIAGAGRPIAFVHLTVAREELAARLERRREHFMPVGLLDSQLGTLEPLEVDEPGLAVRADRAPAAIVADVAEWLGRAEF